MQLLINYSLREKSIYAIRLSMLGHDGHKSHFHKSFGQINLRISPSWKKRSKRSKKCQTKTLQEAQWARELSAFVDMIAQLQNVYTRQAGIQLLASSCNFSRSLPTSLLISGLGACEIIRAWQCHHDTTGICKTGAVGVTLNTVDSFPCQIHNIDACQRGL